MECYSLEATGKKHVAEGEDPKRDSNWDQFDFSVEFKN